MLGWPTHGFQYERLCYHADASLREMNYYNYLKRHGLHGHYDDMGDIEKFCSFENPIPAEHSLEVWTGNEAIEYLKNRDPSIPFFAQVSFERPHPPLSPAFDCSFRYDTDALTLPEDRAEDVGASPFYFNRNVGLKWSIATYGEQELRLALARYYPLISQIDQQIRRIIDHLEISGDIENTPIIFTADHGDFSGEYSRMAKGPNYDAIHRIPMIWHMPEKFSPDERVQGKSLLSIRNGWAAPERDTVYQNNKLNTPCGSTVMKGYH